MILVLSTRKLTAISGTFLDWKLLGINGWNVPLEYIVMRHLSFHGLCCLNFHWFLALSYLVNRQSLDGIMTKLFSASLHDEEVWKCLVLISSLWVIDSQEILKGLSNKRSGTLTVLIKQVLYLSWMTQKYSGLLLPGKLTTAELGHWTSIHCYGKNIPRKWENFVGMKKL